MSSDVSTSKLFEKLKAYKNWSNDSIFFRYIEDASDLAVATAQGKNYQSANENEDDEEESPCFPPEFTHQIFGDEEIIFGYKDLKIDYFLTPGLLHAYIGLNYHEKINSKRFEGIEPDDVCAAFTEFGCSPGFTRNLNVFQSEKLAEDAKFRPFGEKIHQYTRHQSDDNTTTEYEIYRVDGSCTEYHSDKFVDYILRVQTMLIYFIETACFVDTDDPAWTYYLAYEKRKSHTGGDDFRYATIGY